MPIYVSPLQSCVITPSWPYAESCYLFSNNRHKIHDLAFKLGLHSSNFHNVAHFPHYHLTAGKRNQALMKGVTEISEEQLNNFWCNGVIDEDLDDGT